MEVTVEDKLIHTNINPKLGVQKWISGYEINEFYVVLSLCAYKTALRGCLDHALAGSLPARQRSQPQATKMECRGIVPGKAALPGDTTNQTLDL